MVEILEYLPTIWVGKEFDLLGHGGPGFYRDIRWVEPTAADKVEVLQLILNALKKSDVLIGRVP